MKGYVNWDLEWQPLATLQSISGIHFLADEKQLVLK